MSKISAAFDAHRRSGTRGVVPYITAGFPDLIATSELIIALGRAGATVIEVGVPFSDPMADGPVIQRACEQALQSGVSLFQVLTAIKFARAKTDVPVVLFSYLNPLLQYGLARLAKDAAESGVSGVLVTDLPAEIAGGFSAELRKYDIDLITLVAPTSSQDRIGKLAEHASGFLYAVSRTGVTGTQSQISSDARALVDRVKHVTDLPVALGFGISTLEQAREAWSYADAVVIGSALVKLIGETPRQEAIAAAEKFLLKFTEVHTATAATEK